MKSITTLLAMAGLLEGDLDYHLLRASMVIIFFFFGYQNWNKALGALGAVGSCLTFLMTLTIIPFMPNGWAASAGGFPAMTGNVPFLMKQDAVRALLTVRAEGPGGHGAGGRARPTDTIAARPRLARIREWKNGS